MEIPQAPPAIADVLSVFGIWPNIHEMAEAIDQKPDTVSRWRKKRYIPAHAWLKLIAKAAERDATLTIAQLETWCPPRAIGRPRKTAVTV